jgi:type I restriction enzyme S subunit
VGGVGYIDGQRKVCLGQRTVLIRVTDDNLDSRFLFFALQSSDVQEWMKDRSTGSTVSHINVADVRELPLTFLPPLAVQRRIAGVLGALDDLIEVDRLMQEAVLELAKAIYSRAVSDSHEVRTLGSVGRWLSGGTPSTTTPTFWGGPIPWISAASLHSFFVHRSDRTLTIEGSLNGTRMAPEGAILFVVRGMSLKREFRMGVAQRSVAFGQDCKAIVVDRGLPRATVAIALLTHSDELLQLVDEASHGTGRLQTDLIEALEIKLPTAPGIHRVEQALSALLTLGADTALSIEVLTRTRDELLPLLLSGRVSVLEAVA